MSILFNIGSPYFLVPGVTLSRLLSFAVSGETSLADWLVYYIQTNLFVKTFFVPISI